MKAAAVLLVALLFLPVHARGAQLTSCTECHADAARVGNPQWVAMVHEFEKDVHAAVGLSCHDCHGGDPDLAVASSPEAAMDPNYPANPFIGVPARGTIPEFCGRCHSDADYMEDYDPGARVDQLEQYWTSKHGKLLREGDGNVPTCVGCHGTHGILYVTDPDSPVFPTQVAETCSHCHANPKTMAGYTLDTGEPLPVDQYARWQNSVHAASLLERGDLSAPTCNDCHGSHGANPPGLTSAALVCGQCHGREASLFRASAKHAGFEQHNLYLAEATCGDCHTAEPMASVKGVRHFAECTTCHDNHAIVRPTIAMLGPLPEAPCDYCHASAGQALVAETETDAVREHVASVRSTLLEQAQAQGLSGQARFDWLVQQATTLGVHTLEGPSGSTLRPWFKKLFEKFRIGPTHIVYKHPITGEPTSAPVARCGMCHGPVADLASKPVGFETSVAFLTQMQELTTLTAQAERTLLKAQRGGVEAHGALGDLDAAVNAEIRLSSLVHGFTAAEGSPFAKTQAEGVDKAKSALVVGLDALSEIGRRRKGLAVSLGIIALVLIGLGVKIRELARRRAEEDEI